MIELLRHLLLEVCRSFFFFQAEDGIRDIGVTGVQTCALPILAAAKASGVRHVIFGDLFLEDVRAYREQKLARSEEHTSELQSRQYLVCRLLLEKKKPKRNNPTRSDLVSSIASNLWIRASGPTT